MTVPLTEAFVPLPHAPSRGIDPQDFRVLVLDHPERAQPFYTADKDGFRAAASPGAPKPGCEPRVSLQREGDQIAAIHIQCSCGQVIHLACVYPPQG